MVKKAEAAEPMSWPIAVEPKIDTEQVLAFRRDGIVG